MDYYLIDPAGPQLRLPVNPEEASVKREGLFETVNLLDLGEADLAGKGVRIAEISFSSCLPAEYDPSYCNYAELPDPLEAMAQLTAWTEAQTPIRLIITGLDVNRLVTISAQTTTIRGGEPGDVYYDLTCRAWREIRVQIAAAEQAQQPAPAAARPDTKTPPKVYTVRSGDTLTRIAKLELGSSAKWRSIYDMTENKQIIGPNPDLILPGQRLVMPA